MPSLDNYIENKFTIVDNDCVELNVGSSIEVLKKKQGEGWVVEEKLLTMMNFIESTGASLSFESLFELEIERPVWTGITLSLLDEKLEIRH